LDFGKSARILVKLRTLPLLLSFLAAACSPGTGTPDRTVLTYLQALRDGDEAALASCLHPDSKLLKEDARWKDDSKRKASLQAAANLHRRCRSQVTILENHSDAENARIDFRVSSPDPGWSAPEFTLYLRRHEGAWKIVHGSQWEVYAPRQQAELAPTPRSPQSP
jgi:hypothetical protein